MRHIIATQLFSLQQKFLKMKIQKMFTFAHKMPGVLALCMLACFATCNLTGCGGASQPIDQGEYTPVEDELDEEGEQEMSRQLERES